MREADAALAIQACMVVGDSGFGIRDSGFGIRDSGFGKSGSSLDRFGKCRLVANALGVL